MEARTPATTTNTIEVARLDRSLALQLLRAGDRESAWNRLFRVLDRLCSDHRSSEADRLIISTCLELSDLGFVMGKGFGDLRMFLEDALKVSYRLGDKRSHALINLHLGRLYYFGERRHDAIEIFAAGKSEVEELGDEDILTRSSEFLGLYYFIQGLFPEAIAHFEHAVQSFEAFHGDIMINPSAPMWLGYCAAYMGEFHRAIGILDYYHRLSLERGDRSLAATLRAVLGIVLLFAKKNDQAAHLLSGALQEAKGTNNAMALYFSRGALAYHHCIEGRLHEARDLLTQAMDEAAAAGLVRQYSSPFLLEMLYDLHRAGLPPISGVSSFQREIIRILGEPNIHLRGVALGLRAMDRLNRGESGEEVFADLKASEEYLTRACSPVQLAKTRIEMARLELSLGKVEEARSLAQKAWITLCGYGDEFCPDDLRNLVDIRIQTSLGSDQGLLTRFIEIVQELVPTSDMNRLLSRNRSSHKSIFRSRTRSHILVQ